MAGSTRVINVELQATVAGYQSAMKQASKATDGIETGLKKVERAGKGLDPVRLRISNIGVASVGADKRARTFGTGLDKTSKHARGLESGMSGLADGISGVSTLMAEGTKAPADLAIAFANVGSAASTTAIPAIKGVGKGLSGLKGLLTGAGKALSGDLLGGFAKIFRGAGNAGTGIGGFTKKLGAMKGALIGGGIIAGVGALVFAIRELEQAAQARNWDKFITSLERGGDELGKTGEKALLAAAAFGNLEGRLRQVADEGGIRSAQRFVELAEKAGLPAPQLEKLRNELNLLEGEFDSSGSAIDDAVASLEAYQDQVRAMTDPLFNAIKAQKDWAEALKTGDPVAQAEAVLRLESAMAELKTAVDTGTVSLDAARGMLHQWVADGLITQGAADALSKKFGLTTAASQTLGRQRPVVVVSAAGVPQTNEAFRRVRAAAELIPKSKRITITADGSSAIATANGVVRHINGLTGTITIVSHTVPSHQTFGGGQAAGGPIRSDKWYVVGERGPEIFAPGQTGTIIPNSGVGTVPASNFGGGGGAAGGPVVHNHFHIAGSVLSEGDLIRTVNKAVANGRVHDRGRRL